MNAAIEANNTESMNNVNVMSIEDMRRIAPHIFCSAPTNPHLSKHYTFASTQTVINDMAKLGWYVVDAAQPHPRRKSSVSSFHKVTFQGNSTITRTLADGTEDVYYPRIVLTNSHDGYNSFCFRISLFRVNTGRDIIINTDKFEKIYLRHIGYSFEELRNLVNTVVEEVPNQVKVMNQMKDRVLSQEEKYKLAEAAIRARSTTQPDAIPDFILDEILESNGCPDDNLWDVFNLIMDKLIDGDFRQLTKKGVRKARMMKSVSKTITVSQAIFRAASELL